MMEENHPVPVRLRPVLGDAIGTTAFFRNRPLFQTVLDKIVELDRQEVRVLFHACSIGAEVYSFVIQYLLGGYKEKFELTCTALDKAQEFVDYARSGQYPLEVTGPMSIEERKCFVTMPHAVEVGEDVRCRIKFLPAASFVSFESPEPFDVVFLLNALVYVPCDVQAGVIDRISSYNRSVLVTTAFHQDTITRDLQRNNYRPYPVNIEAIHNAWVDRRRDTPIDPSTLPPHIYADWSLPPFSEIPDYEYKYGAIFIKD